VTLFDVSKWSFASLLLTIALAATFMANAQPAKVYRVGVIHEGGDYKVAVDGLKDGLHALGLEPGKSVLLDIHDVQGNRAAVEDVAKNLEEAKVDVLFTLSTSATVVAKGATKEVPIVFVIGGDSVAEGLVASLAKPGGRLTGVQRLSTDFTGKRLEILKEIVPGVHRVVTFYDPSNDVSIQAAKLAREAARQLKIDVVERPVASVAELRQAFSMLDRKDADAFFYVSDAMVTSQSSYIIDSARAKKLPTMFSEPELVTRGALAGYGASRYEAGRLAARYVQRVVTGTSPKDLPVESFSRYQLGINLQTARDLGITIPQSILFRAEKVIE